MSRLLHSLLPLSLLVLALSGNSTVFAQTPRTTTGSKADPTGMTGLDRLCANHYNKLGLKVGKYEQVKAIIERDKKASVSELTASLNAKNITLNEASWGLYYLGQKAIQNDDFPTYVKYLTIAADDYLNPWAMVKLAKVYYYDKAQWKKDFPKTQITTDKDLERSYTYLILAFHLGGEIEKAHHDNSILTGVANGGLALKDTFEGTGISGFDTRLTLQKHRAYLLARADAYQKMYEKGPNSSL